jgi:hypothetical protein
VTCDLVLPPATCPLSVYPGIATGYAATKMKCVSPGASAALHSHAPFFCVVLVSPGVEGYKFSFVPTAGAAREPFRPHHRRRCIPYPLTAVHPTRNSVAAAVHADFARFILPTETRFDHMWVPCRAFGALLSQFRHVLVVWAADVGADGPVVCAPAPFAGSIETEILFVFLMMMQLCSSMPSSRETLAVARR